MCISTVSRSHIRDTFSVNSIQLSGLNSRGVNESHTPNVSHLISRRISSVIEEGSVGGGLQGYRDRIQSLQTPVPDLVR